MYNKNPGDYAWGIAARSDGADHVPDGIAEQHRPYLVSQVGDPIGVLYPSDDVVAEQQEQSVDDDVRPA